MVLHRHPGQGDIDSQRCQGSITINKHVEGPLDPDPGLFNLEIDREPIAGPRATAGREAAVSVGPHTVGESGAEETNLSDFDTRDRLPHGRW